jgi:gentisate 1,2-dioxygenase
MIAPPASREEYVRRIKTQHLAPLWDVLPGLVTAEPKTVIAPYRWRYRDVRPTLLESAGIITAKEAARRVLVFENPKLPGESKITNSLFGGFQLIMPGEVAPPHRHIQSALRFIIEGDGAYTGVDGERTIMRPGDFVITPSWTYHDHGNNTQAPMVWLDGLDMHMVRLFEASFREGWVDDEPIEPTKPEFDSIHRYGANMVPVESTYNRPTSPVFSYPYERTREALGALQRAEAPSPSFGYKMRYINPLTGGDAIPTMSTFMQLLPKGFETKPYRSTDSTVFVPVEGTGSTTVGGETFDWEPHDVIVIPSWMKYTHKADTEATIFSYSDRGPQELLGYWRDEK